MMPAAKALDPLLGIDIHIMQPPGPVPPVPLPNPYIGMVFDPMDFVPFVGATTRIGGLPRAQAGTAGQALPPHLPIGGVFVKPPSNESEIFMGSAVVSIDGDAAAYMALPVLSCVCVGMPPIPRLKKKKTTKSLVLPLTKVLAIPGPVFIGGPPTISLTAMLGRAGLGNLLLLKSFIESGCDPMILVGLVAGKLMGKLQGLANKGLGKLSNKLFAKAKGKFKGKARPPKGQQGRPHGNGSTCTSTEPIHTISGEMYTTYLDARAGGERLFSWERSYSSALNREQRGLGLGFRHSYMSKLELFAQGYRFETYTREVHYFTPVTDVGETAVANGYVMYREAHDRVTIARPGEPTLHFELSNQRAPRLILLSRGSRRLLLEYDAEQLTGLQEGAVVAGIARLTGRYLLQYYPNGFLYAVYRVDDASTTRDTSGYTCLARYEYDPNGRLIHATNALGGVHAYHYDLDGRVVQATDPRGYSFTWRYDAQGRAVESAGHDGLWWGKLDYFPGETHIQECNQGVFIHKYDSSGRLLEVHDPYGGVRKRELDPSDGRVIRETDTAGRVTEWLYDDTLYHYARRNQYGHLQLPEEVDGSSPDPHEPNVARTAIEREFGFKPDSRAAFGPGSLLLRDASLDTARILVSTNPRPSRAQLDPERRFNERGDLIEEIEPNGRRRTWEYDACGNLLSYRDADNRVFRQEIIRWNLLGAKVDPLGSAVRFQFTDNELVASTTDQLGNVTTYEYDDKDRLVRVKRANVVEDEYLYDVGDRLVEKRDANGRTLLRFEHDKRSMVKHVVLADGSQHFLDYDRFGKSLVASTGQHEVLMVRDDTGRLLSERVDGRGIEVSHLGDRHVLFARFAFRRWRYGQRVVRTQSTDVTVLWDPTLGKHRVRFDATGLIRRETPAGTIEFTRFDDAGHVDARVIEWRDAHGHVHSWTRAYERSAEGDLLAIQDSRSGRTVYTVDPAHRVVGESGPRGTYRYSLDAANNLIEKPGLSGVVVGAHNTLASANGRRFSYNARTHVAESYDPTTRRTVRYTYNARDLLIRIEVGHLDGEDWIEEVAPWTAEYDATGRRLSSGRPGARRSYFWREQQLVAEVTEQGALRLYGYVDESAWVPLYIVDYDSVEAEPGAGQVYSVFGDHLGMPVAVEDGFGKIVWRAQRTDPYGDVRVEPGNEIELSLRWPGHYFDADTGLFYNRYRYYDPKLGRYLQSDPIGQRGGINVYAYPPNPLRSVDVIGLHGETKSSRSQGDGGDAHPGKKGADDADGKATPKRDKDGKLRNADGTFADDPNAAGDKKVTHKATKTDVETKAKLDPNDPAVKKNVDDRNAAIKERDEARARGDEEAAGKAQAKANKATENLGNQAAEAHVKDKYPNAERMHSGEGPGTHDNVFKTNSPNSPPDPKLVVAEGKGGTATNSSSRAGPNGERHQQGTPEHFDTTNQQMAKNPESAETAQALQDAKPGEVERIEVSQPLDKNGDPTDMKVSKYGPSEVVQPTTPTATPGGQAP